MGNQCVRANDTETDDQFEKDSRLSSVFQNLTSDLIACWRELLLVTVITSFFSALIIFLMRYAASFIIWSILLSTIVVGFILSCYFAYKFATAKKETPKITYGVAMAVAMVASMIFICIVFMVRKKIKMVIELFIEAGKTISDVPSMLFQPFVVKLI